MEARARIATTNDSALARPGPSAAIEVMPVTGNRIAVMM